MTKVHQSFPEENIKIARLCGWAPYESCLSIRYNGEHHVFGDLWVKGDEFTNWLPDYILDLTAIHEAERCLSGDQTIRYSDLLEKRVQDFHLWSATAAERSRCLIILLDEEQQEKKHD